MITINGKIYSGNSISVNNDIVIIDGKRVDDDDKKVINIKVEGNIETLDVDYCDEINITGDCKTVTSKNGNIQVKGNVSGDVTSKNGNIVCRDVTGDVETKNGNIVHQ